MKYVLFTVLLAWHALAAADDFEKVYCQPLSDAQYLQQIVGTWKSYPVQLEGKTYDFKTSYRADGTVSAKLINGNEILPIGEGAFTIKGGLLTVTFINEGYQNASALKLACMGPHLFEGFDINHKMIANVRE